MNQRVFLPFLIVAMMWSPPAEAAQHKPSLAVRFRLTGDNYRRFFKPSEMSEMQGRLGSACVAALSDYFSLFAFVDSVGSDILTIDLGDSTTLNPEKVWFRIRLSGPNVGLAGDDVTWIYRERKDGPERLMDMPSLEANISRSFDDLIRQSDRRSELVTRLLCRLNLTSTLVSMPSGFSCHRCRVLPFDKDETLVEDTSRFEVRQVLDLGGGTMKSLCHPGRVWGHDGSNQIILELGEDRDEPDLTSPSLRLKMVRVIDYVRSIPSSGNPLNVVNSGGSPR